MILIILLLLSTTLKYSGSSGGGGGGGGGGGSSSGRRIGRRGIVLMTYRNCLREEPTPWSSDALTCAALIGALSDRAPRDRAISPDRHECISPDAGCALR